MRAQAHQLQHVCSRLPVNQNKVGLDVAVTMIFPLPCERVTAIFFGHCWSFAKAATMVTKSR